MTRREFSGALAGSIAVPAFASGSPSLVVTLQAIAGATLPATLTVSTNSPGKMLEGLWELRSYRGATPALAKYFIRGFPRAGIRPLLRKTNGPDLTYLIPFEDLTVRDQAWTALNADPAWTHARTQFQSYHFGLYRAV